MFGKLVEMSGRICARPSERLKIMLGLVAGFALLGGSKAMGQIPAGSVALFTTVQDFTGWSNGGGSPVTSFGPVGASVYDADQGTDTTDGLANNSAAGTPGSMQINTGGNAIGNTYTVFSSPNVLYNTAVMSIVDPGFTTPGQTVASSNTMYITYTAPQWADVFSTDVYYQVGVDLSYPGDSYYGTFFENNVINDGVIDGLQTYTAVIPYTIAANSGGGNFSVSPALNAGVYGSGVYGFDNVMTTPWYVDDIDVAPVPEPATLSVFGAALSMLMFRRRRKA
jgi:hypothetical protein